MQVIFHAHLVKLFYWVIPTVGVAMFCLGSLWLMSDDARALPALIVFAGAGSLFYLLLWSLPVRCKAPGCHGRVKWTLAQVSDWAPIVKSKLEYRCPVCHDHYETSFFHVPFYVGGPD